MKIALAVILLALTVGCSERTTYPVSGTVALDGEPVKWGKIMLIDPEMKLDSDVGNIVDGRFEFDAKPGKKRVELRSPRDTGIKSEFGGTVTEEALPRRYNSDSELAVEVASDTSNNVYSFDLESN